MDNMIKVYRPDYCLECRTPRSIEIYNYFDSPIGYSRIIDNIEEGGKVSFDKVPIYYARCKNCRKKFVIFWKDGIPIPYSDSVSELKVFLSNYKKPKDIKYNPEEK